MRLLILSDLHLEFAGLQPSWVCRDCADKFRLGNWRHSFSMHNGKCEVCNLNRPVTTPDNCGALSCAWMLQRPAPDEYDAVILAGDIHTHTQGIRWAANTFSKPVLMTLGNHEAYGQHLHALMIEAHQTAQAFPNIHLLDNSSVVIDGVRFVGATLWTSFTLFGEDLHLVGKCLSEAKNRINDFSNIRFGSTGWMSPSDSVKLHRVSVAYLERELQQAFDGKTVVVTHHLPSMKLVADQYKTDLLSSAFASNLDKLVEQADLWVAGHTHDSFDTQIGKCRCIVNPKGYPDRRGNSENENFNPALIVEI